MHTVKYYLTIKKHCERTSLVVQWLRPSALNPGDPGLIHGQGTRSHMLQLKILHAATKTQCGQINNLTAQHYGKLKKSCTKDYILYDFIYMKYPKQANPQKQKVYQCLYGWRRRADMNRLIGMGFFFEGIRYPKIDHGNNCTPL